MHGSGLHPPRYSRSLDYTMSKVRPMIRFLRHVNSSSPSSYDGSPCWDWTGYRDRDGYALFTDEAGTTVRGMRWAYEAIRETLGELVPDHLCRRVQCVNPYHAEAVTPTENKRRGIGWAGLNAKKTHCLRGHEFTPDNTFSPDGVPHHRACRTCRRLTRRLAYKRRKEQELQVQI